MGPNTCPFDVQILEYLRTYNWHDSWCVWFQSVQSVSFSTGHRRLTLRDRVWSTLFSRQVDHRRYRDDLYDPSYYISSISDQWALFRRHTLGNNLHVHVRLNAISYPSVCMKFKGNYQDLILRARDTCIFCLHLINCSW